MKNQDKFIKEALQREIKNFSKFKRGSKPGDVCMLNNRWRTFFGMNPIYFGIVLKDEEYINSAFDNEEERKVAIKTSGKEKYIKAFKYLLRTTNNTLEEIENILAMQH
ncbi:MAG: hypothetical protein ABIH79_02405 [archaeon]